MGKEFETRWVTMPALAVIALASGANPWVVALAFASGFRFFIRY